MVKKIIMILFTFALIIWQTFCEQILKVTYDRRRNFYANLKVGTPPVDQLLQISFGYNDDSDLGNFIFDSSIMQYDRYYYQQYLSQLTLYDMKKSSTAQIISANAQSENSNGYVKGSLVKDKMRQGKNQDFTFKFLSANKVSHLQIQNCNGLMIFDRNQENIFDMMYSQGIISTTDYILKGYNTIDQDQYTILNVDFHYDLDQSSEYYKYPSNQLINGNMFNIKAYGIYLNGYDVTDKLKFRTIAFDDPYGSQYLQVPFDLFNMITQDSYIQNILNERYIKNCPYCKCKETSVLPTFKLITEEYIFEITPDMYTNYQLSLEQTEYVCFVSLIGFDGYFRFSYQLSLIEKAPIMYQKDSNSMKFIGQKTVSHINTDILIPILSLLNGFTLISLLSLIFFIYKKYKFLSTEFYRDNRYLKCE